MVRDFPVCPSNSNGTLTNYSRVGIGLVRGRYKQPALRLRVHALLSFFTRAHASKGLPDNPMVIVSARQAHEEETAARTSGSCV